jgi:hypothetical protein
LKKSHTARTRHPRKAAIALALGLLSSPGWAVDYFWQGGAGLWTDANRWTLLGVPGIGDSATLGSGTLQLTDTRSVDAFTVNGGWFGGPGTLNTGRLVFNDGRMGYSTSTGGGVTNVSGSSLFNGTALPLLDYSHSLNLNGNSTWTAGDGRIQVLSAYQAGATVYPAARLAIGAGATFTDQGAASASGLKFLGSGGAIDNAGTYQRNGLGNTGIVNLNNTGTVNVNAGYLILYGDGGRAPNTQSSGTINVAAGSFLQFFSSSNADSSLITAGTIANNGLVRVSGTNVKVAASASISGAWQIDGNTAVLQIAGVQNLASLVQDTGAVAGAGTLNVGSLVFNGGRMGYSTATGGGVLNVSGAATFNGAAVQRLDYSHTLNLKGNSTWTAGNGSIDVAGAYFAPVLYPSARLSMAAGTIFTDMGASSATEFKQIRGGEIINAGTYVRTGLGTTVTANFDNLGTLDIRAGVVEVDDTFRNRGSVFLASDTLLWAYRDGFRNDGTITGTGTVRTLQASRNLNNLGTLDPGTLAGAGAAGTLTVDGNLSLAPTSTLRIDFDLGGHVDRLAITGLATLGGTLAAWAVPGQVFELGQSFVVLTVGQGSNMGGFSGFTWLGEGANPFSLRYAPQSVILSVTTAVPEPATWAFMLVGLAGLMASASRRKVMS